MESRPSSRPTSCPVRARSGGSRSKGTTVSRSGPPTASRVAFQSDRQGDPAVFWQPAVGGTAERLTTPDPGTSHTPESWSPDGDVLLFSATKGSISSLWTFSLKDRKATLFGDVKASTLPTNAMFSPDGRWVAYQIGQPGVTEGTTYVAAVSAHRDEASDRAARWAAVVVPRRQGTVLRAGAGPLHGGRREDGTDLHGHESGRGASRIRGGRSDRSAHVRHHARRPDCRRRHGRPEPKRIAGADSGSADSSRAELVRGAEVESANEVAIRIHLTSEDPCPSGLFGNLPKRKSKVVVLDGAHHPGVLLAYSRQKSSYLLVV